MVEGQVKKGQELLDELREVVAINVALLAEESNRDQVDKCKEALAATEEAAEVGEEF